MEILWEAAKSSNNKRYKCPYCELRLERQKLIRHIEDKHEEEIPEGFTPTRIVFNLINKKDHGNCVICGAETKWDENKARYDRICEKPECMNKYKEQVKSRMIKIYGTDNLLNDPQQQQKMLASRSISGTYKFSDGTPIGYTGSYEKKTLQFLDKVMGFKSEDIITPGPIVEYEYGGKKHFWITDIYIPSYHLCIDVKDGKNNKNKRPMKEYREKQIAKEKAIIDQKQYNYLRLTDNDFGQLMSILAELKLQLLDNNTGSRIVRIHENMFPGIGAMMPMETEEGDTFIVNYMKNNIFSGISLVDSPFMEQVIVQDSSGVLHKTNYKFFDGATFNIYRIKGDRRDVFKSLLEKCDGDPVHENYILCELFGKYPLTDDEWICREDVEEICDIYSYMNAIYEIAKANVELHEKSMRFIDEAHDLSSPVALYRDSTGFYLENATTGMRSQSKEKESEFSDIERSIIEGGIF